jgi:hypothetical protein
MTENVCSNRDDAGSLMMGRGMDHRARPIIIEGRSSSAKRGQGRLKQTQSKPRLASIRPN